MNNRLQDRRVHGNWTAITEEGEKGCLLIVNVGRFHLPIYPWD